MRLELAVWLIVGTAALLGAVLAEDESAAADSEIAVKQSSLKANYTIDHKATEESPVESSEEDDETVATEVEKQDEKVNKKSLKKRKKKGDKKLKTQKLKEKKKATKALKKKDKKKKKQEKVEARKQKKVNRKAQKEEKKKERKQARLVEKNERKALKKRNRQELRQLKKAQKKALREGSLDKCETPDDCTDGGCCIGEGDNKFCSLPRSENFKCNEACQCSKGLTCHMKSDTLGKCIKEEKFGSLPIA